MGVIKLLEGTQLTWGEWCSQLGVDRLSIEHLVSERILRARGGGLLQLTFVGIVAFPNSLLFARPKFDTDGSFDLPRTVRILQHYFARSALRRSIVDAVNDPEYGNTETLREFDVLLRLQEWFYTYGLYRTEQTKRSDQGRPHWNKTIAKCSPVLIQGSVIYPSMIGERREDVLNEISALQVGILRRLQERYDFDTPGVIKHAEQITGLLVPHWPLPDDQRSYFERRLAHEQRSVYRTDSLQLLNLLRELLGLRLAGASTQPQIYGTTAFYSVWEDACRMTTGVDSQADPASLLGQPVWWSNNDYGHKIRYEQQQIPDIVIVRGSRRFVVDAKYYYRFPMSRPGGPDIVKQLYYVEALRAPVESVLSIFLVPLPGREHPKFLGYSTIEGANRQFPQIEVWGLDPIQLFSRYPSPSARGADDLIDSILARRDRVTEFVSQAPAHICE